MDESVRKIIIVYLYIGFNVILVFVLIKRKILKILKSIFRLPTFWRYRFNDIEIKLLKFLIIFELSNDLRQNIFLLFGKER